MKDDTPCSYGVLFFKGDELCIVARVAKRMPQYANDEKFDDLVYIDQRDDSRLLPLPYRVACKRRHLISNVQRTAKIARRSRRCQRARNLLFSSNDARVFRGSFQNTTDKPMFKVTHHRDLQYRGGIMDEGRMSDLKVEPITGVDQSGSTSAAKVSKTLSRADASGRSLVSRNHRTVRFALHTDSTDALYTESILSGTGYANERNYRNAHVCPKDVLVLSCGIGDTQTGEVAHYRHSVHIIPEETPTQERYRATNEFDTND